MSRSDQPYPDYSGERKPPLAHTGTSPGTDADENRVGVVPDPVDPTQQVVDPQAANDPGAKSETPDEPEDEPESSEEV